MCSDGLSDMIDDATIAQIICGEGTLEHRCELLVGAANDNGGRDNITVMAVQVTAESEKRGLISRLLGK